MQINGSSIKIFTGFGLEAILFLFFLLPFPQIGFIVFLLNGFPKKKGLCRTTKLNGNLVAFLKELQTTKQNQSQLREVSWG